MKNWKKNKNRVSSAIPNYKANAQKKKMNIFQNNIKNKNKPRMNSTLNKFNNNKNKIQGLKEIEFMNFFEIKQVNNNNKFKLNNKNNKTKPKGNERYNMFNEPVKVNNKFNFKSQNKLPDINNRNINKEQNKLFLLNKGINPFISADNFYNKKIKVNIVNNNHINLKIPFNNNPNKIINKLNNSLDIKRKINNNPLPFPQKKKPNRPQSSIPSKAPKIILITKKCANGLQNIGATCYMNATIQCMAHVQKLTYYFLDSDNKKKLSLDKNKYELSLAYLTVVENLWQKNVENKYYAPYEFKDVISRKNPLFAGIQANDSKDLIIFLMETMHKELNVVKNNNNIDILTDDISSAEQYNFEITFKKFATFFKENYNSPISNLFYGMFNSMMQCQNCNIITNNVQCFNIIIFPLQKVLEFKPKFINMVNLYECFEYYQRPDYMGGKSFYCNKCRQMADNINTTKLLYGPKIMVINLNRGRGLEFDVKLDIDEYIDIANYVYFKDKSYTYYELIGIVTHFGESSMSGHFIAFCKSFGDQQWYKYNDALVSKSSFEEAKSTGVPYILIFSYIKR